MSIAEELIFLPADWRLVRVGPDKAPIGADWQSIPGLSPDDAIELPEMPPAWGLLSGPQSGCIVLDLDEDGWREDFAKRTGHPIEDLPQTIAWTSGKPGRSGRAFAVDDEWWPHLANRRPFTRPWREGDPIGEQGKKSPVTLWELRGDRHQAVIIGAHPETGSYRWLEGCAPSDLSDPAEAPEWLLELMVVQELAQAAPVVPQDGDADRAIAMLAAIPAEQHSNYDDWLRIGMALHSVDPGLLTNWVEWSKGMAAFDEGECLYKWQSFGKSNKGRPATIATLCYVAKQHGYKEPRGRRKAKAKSKAIVGRDSGSSGDLGGPDDNGASDESAPKPKRPFGLLGFAGDDFYYQPDESGQVTVISGPRHSAINMLRLARRSYWSKKYPRFNKDGDFIGIDWAGAFDDLFSAQYRVGFFDPERIRGLGAWWDRKRVVLHLGDRLIVDGEVHYLTQPFDSTYHYQRLRRLEGPGDAVPLSDAEAMQVIEIASAFQWEDPSSAFLLAGWLAIAAICGCLKWRPHLWLTAAKGTGKSTIIDRFVGVLLGDLFIQPEGTATEAGIRQDLMSSAMAVVHDEAGAAKEKDKIRIQAIIEFARSCSKEGKGKIMKGSSDQSGAKKFSPKAIFLLSSVTTALREGQDSSRFSQLTLKKNESLTKEQQAKHWADLDMTLASTITEEFALRLIARTINLIPMIREAVDVFEVATAEHLGTPRLGEQYGALAAGAWSLCSQVAPTLEEAREWLKQHPLVAQAENSEVDDEKSCLQTILEHQLRVDVDMGVKTATVLALLEIAADRRFQDDGIDKHRAVKALGAIGVGVKDGRLMVSNTAKALRKLLRETPFESCWPTVLARMPDARKPENAVWFAGVGTTRATSLPLPQFKDEDEGFVSE
jgi:hypothetical protein